MNYRLHNRKKSAHLKNFHTLCWTLEVSLFCAIFFFIDSGSNPFFWKGRRWLAHSQMGKRIARFWQSLFLRNREKNRTWCFYHLSKSGKVCKIESSTKWNPSLGFQGNQGLKLRNHFRLFKKVFLRSENLTLKKCWRWSEKSQPCGNCFIS